jgi:hypothetical protein
VTTSKPDETRTPVTDKTTDAEKFFDEIVKHPPQLQGLGGSPPQM